jgi:hypothetical protein
VAWAQALYEQKLWYPQRFLQNLSYLSSVYRCLSCLSVFHAPFKLIETSGEIHTSYPELLQFKLSLVIRVVIPATYRQCWISQDRVDGYFGDLYTKHLTELSKGFDNIAVCGLNMLYHVVVTTGIVRVGFLAKCFFVWTETSLNAGLIGKCALSALHPTCQILHQRTSRSRIQPISACKRPDFPEDYLCTNSTSEAILIQSKKTCQTHQRCFMMLHPSTKNSWEMAVPTANSQ